MNFSLLSRKPWSLPTAVTLLIGTACMPLDALANPVVAQVPPASTALPANPILEQLQRLEQKQQALEAEIQTLKQQLADRALPPAATGTANSTMTRSPAQPSPQNFSFSTAAVFLQPTTSSLMDFAIVDQGTALATSGQIARVNYDGLTTPRWRLSYRAPDANWDFSASHMRFQADGSAAAVRPTNGFLFSTFSHPFQNDSADTATAASELKYQMTDVELGQTIKLDDRFNLRAFGGIRVGHINQAMTVNLDGRDFTQAVLNNSSSFAGVGPRLGAELNWNLATDLTLFGRGSGTLLVGSRNLSTRETDNNGQDTVVDLSEGRDSQIVPGFDLALGLTWRPMISRSTNLDMSVGYEYQHWLNAGESIRFTDAATPGSLVTTQSDVSLKGFFLRLGLSTNF